MQFIIDDHLRKLNLSEIGVKNISTPRKEKIMKNYKNRLCLLCLIISLLLIVTVASTTPDEVYVGGMPFGIRFEAGEVSVVKTNSFLSGGENVSPAEDAGIMADDIIKKINDTDIMSTKDVLVAVKNTKNDLLDFTIERNGKILELKLAPKISDKTGEIQLGVMLKDSSAGIGTVTFIKDDSLIFAGLGHGICDVKSGEILNIKNGYISNVTINGVNIGKCGAPGELRGIIDTEKCGKLLSNTEVGIYGLFSEKPDSIGEKIKIATPDEVEVGKAKILCTLADSKCCEYEIEIAEINKSVASKTKNYIVKVTDKDLLSKTGGIVQGMSGSPIIQNGKLVGAVTHVMINDPTTGYGIYIGNMLEEMEKAV